MSNGSRDQRSEFVLPRPGRALKGVLLTLFAIWLMFAVGINWAGASDQSFLLWCGNTERILRGEVWRLFTAPLMHMPSGDIGHIVTALLGLYFLSPSLEEHWGSWRFLRFLLFSAWIAYALQMAVGLALPASISDKLAGQYWFGAIPAVEAIAIAWALSFRGRVVRLFLMVPVSSQGLILFVVAFSTMYLLVAAQSPGGLIAPFGGMIAGWLLGGATPSPLRRFYLRFRLAQLDLEARRGRSKRRELAKSSGLRLLEGGRKSQSGTRRSGNGSPGKNGNSGENGDGGGRMTH